LDGGYASTSLIVVPSDCPSAPSKVSFAELLAPIPPNGALEFYTKAMVEILEQVPAGIAREMSLFRVGRDQHGKQ
jgi:hypothetical protein